MNERMTVSNYQRSAPTELFLVRPLSRKLKGQPFVMIVVRLLSVRLSVTNVLWLNGAR